MKKGSIAKKIICTDVAAITVGNLPPNSIITDVFVLVGTAFNASSNDYIDVGISGTQNKFANDVDVSSTGKKSATLTGVGAVESASTSTPITALYVPAGSSPTTGSAYIVVEYTQL